MNTITIEEDKQKKHSLIRDIIIMVEETTPSVYRENFNMCINLLGNKKLSYIANNILNNLEGYETLNEVYDIVITEVLYQGENKRSIIYN